MHYRNFVYINRAEVPSRAAWQAALEQLDLPLVLHPEFQPFETFGEVPCAVYGAPTDFDISYEVPAPQLAEDGHAAATKDTCICLGWQDIAGCAAVTMASYALAHSFGGIVAFEGGEPESLDQTREAVQAALQDLLEATGGKPPPPRTSNRTAFDQDFDATLRPLLESQGFQDTTEYVFERRTPHGRNVIEFQVAHGQVDVRVGHEPAEMAWMGPYHHGLTPVLEGTIRTPGGGRWYPLAPEKRRKRTIEGLRRGLTSGVSEHLLSLDDPDRFVEWIPHKSVFSRTPALVCAGRFAEAKAAAQICWIRLQRRVGEMRDMSDAKLRSLYVHSPTDGDESGMLFCYIANWFSQESELVSRLRELGCRVPTGPYPPANR